MFHLKGRRFRRFWASCVCPLSGFGNKPKTTQQQERNGNKLFTPVRLIWKARRRQARLQKSNAQLLGQKPQFSNGSCRASQMESVGKTKRNQHAFPICRHEGHHARTCRDVLVEENRERSDTVFNRLMNSRKFDKHLAAMAVRVSTQFAGIILYQVKTSEKTRQVFLASQGAGSRSKNDWINLAGCSWTGKERWNQKKNRCHSLESCETPGNIIKVKTLKRLCGIHLEGKRENGLFCFGPENAGPKIHCSLKMNRKEGNAYWRGWGDCPNRRIVCLFKKMRCW